MTTPAKPLYVFIDESGNFDFTGRGTDYFVMSAVMTDRPLESAGVMQALKYELMAEGIENPEFHAAENSLATRARASAAINGLTNIAVHSIYADKHLAHPSKHSDIDFYSLFAVALSKWLLKSIRPEYDYIVIVFDVALTKRQQKAVLANVKPTLAALGRPYSVMFHAVKADLNGQIADYFAWSVFRHLESGDPLPLAAIGSITHERFNLFRTGHTRYW
jgi:hypothetical protein